MTLRVTFDTNVLDLACRPERFPKDPRQPHLRKIRDALAAKTLEGFYPVTMLTIEGIMKRDRAEVFARTTLKQEPEQISVTKNADLPESIRAVVGNADVETIAVRYAATQPRRPLHPEVLARIQAATALGVRALKAVPRIGAYEFPDSTGDFYFTNGEGDALKAWCEKCCEVGRAIESRGLGIAQVKALGNNITSDPADAWFSALDKAKDIHQQRAIERAFGEWADADAIASHIAYGIDVFCSEDIGNSNATNSIFDITNRAWLAATYGVKFMTFDELFSSLP